LTAQNRAVSYGLIERIQPAGTNRCGQPLAGRFGAGVWVQRLSARTLTEQTRGS